MNGMIFAAGLGSRLSPLTDTMPKALVAVDGKPLLWHAINHLYSYGVRHLVVNVHHFAAQVINFLNTQQWPNLNILISDESDLLLDTGGGLLKAFPLFKSNEPILVANADVFSNAPLDLMIDQHQKNQPAVTLMTMVRPSTRQLQFNSHGLLSGWVNHETSEVKIARRGQVTHEAAFCGFHIIELSFLELLTAQGKFPIMDAYLQQATTVDIQEFLLPSGYFWFDVGTSKKLDAVNDFVANKNCKNDNR